MTLSKSEYVAGEEMTVSLRNASEQNLIFANAAYGLYFEVNTASGWATYATPPAVEVITPLAPDGQGLVRYTLGADARFPPGRYRAVATAGLAESEFQARTSQPLRATQEFEMLSTLWLTWQRTGGIAGLREDLEIHTDGRAVYESSHFGRAEVTLSGPDLDQLHAVLNEAQFFALAGAYAPRGNAADYFEYAVTVHAAPMPKTVAWVDEWAALDPLPQGLIRLQDALGAIVDHVRPAGDGGPDPSARAVEIARESLTQAPTFKFDGMPETLQVTDVVVLESFPEQYVVTLTFDSRHAGYGDRTGLVLAQVITSHVAVIRVVQEQVVSAVLDQQWNELNQEPPILTQTLTSA
jgi:hypothetical protein